MFQRKWCEECKKIVDGSSHSVATYCSAVASVNMYIILLFVRKVYTKLMFYLCTIIHGCTKNDTKWSDMSANQILTRRHKKVMTL